MQLKCLTTYLPASTPSKWLSNWWLCAETTSTTTGTTSISSLSSLPMWVCSSNLCWASVWAQQRPLLDLSEFQELWDSSEKQKTYRRLFRLSCLPSPNCSTLAHSCFSSSFCSPFWVLTFLQKWNCTAVWISTPISSRSPIRCSLSSESRRAKAGKK